MTQCPFCAHLVSDKVSEGSTKLLNYGGDILSSHPYCASLPPGFSSGYPHEQHGDGGQADNTLCHTAQDQMVEPPPPMGP